MVAQARPQSLPLAVHLPRWQKTEKRKNDGLCALIGKAPMWRAKCQQSLISNAVKKRGIRDTPCNFMSHEEVINALAEVHVELMLIHPFREGNGRLGRMFATLMALQAGLPILDFSDWDGEKRETYFAAVRAGLDRNYRPMQELFAGIIENSLLSQ